MAWTTASEVIAAWIGPDAPTSTVLVDVWIGKAERLLRAKVPTLTARLAVTPVTEPDLLGNVKDVTTAMVQRVFRNPEGVRSRQESTGPFGGSVTYGGDQPGALWVTDAELALISKAGTNRGAYVINAMPTTSPFYVAPVT